MKLLSTLGFALIFSSLSEALEFNTTEIKRVIIIGLDGAGSFHQLYKPQHLTALGEVSAHCPFGDTVFPTSSGQNWGSILTGVLPTKHGVHNGNIKDGYYKKKEYPTLFKLITEKFGMDTVASLVKWAPINVGLIEEELTITKMSDSDDRLVPKIVNYIKQKGESTRFLFIHLDDLDYAGHNYGWLSPQYKQQYVKTDAHVGTILKGINDANLRESSLIIITSDHGGKDNTHGGSSIEESRVLFLVNGPHVKIGELQNRTAANMDAFAITLTALGMELPDYMDAKIPEGTFA